MCSPQEWRTRLGPLDSAAASGWGSPVSDDGEVLSNSIDALEHLADRMTPQEAVAELDAADLQTFWREWPNASAWAGTLWRLLEADLAVPAQAEGDADAEEVGGSG